MKPRRPCRRRRKATLMWDIQRHRLARIAAGEIEPRYERERWFLWSLQAGERVNYADFIVPGLMFLAEDEMTRADVGPPAPS